MSAIRRGPYSICRFSSIPLIYRSSVRGSLIQLPFKTTARAMSVHHGESALRPEPDKVLKDIADYVHNYSITSDVALETARLCLIDTVGCGLEALRFPECTKLLGPVVEGTTVPNGMFLSILYLGKVKSHTHLKAPRFLEPISNLILYEAHSILAQRFDGSTSMTVSLLLNVSFNFNLSYEKHVIYSLLTLENVPLTS